MRNTLVWKEGVGQEVVGDEIVIGSERANF